MPTIDRTDLSGLSERVTGDLVGRRERLVLIPVDDLLGIDVLAVFGVETCKRSTSSRTIQSSNVSPHGASFEKKLLLVMSLLWWCASLSSRTVLLNCLASTVSRSILIACEVADEIAIFDVLPAVSVAPVIGDLAAVTTVSVGIRSSCRRTSHWLGCPCWGRSAPSPHLLPRGRRRPEWRPLFAYTRGGRVVAGSKL